MTVREVDVIHSTVKQSIFRTACVFLIIIKQATHVYISSIWN